MTSFTFTNTNCVNCLVKNKLRCLDIVVLLLDPTSSQEKFSSSRRFGEQLPRQPPGRHWIGSQGQHDKNLDEEQSLFSARFTNLTQNQFVCNGLKAAQLQHVKSSA